MKVGLGIIIFSSAVGGETFRIFKPLLNVLTLLYNIFRINNVGKFSTPY